MNCTRIHVWQIFANSHPYPERKPKCISEFEKNMAVMSSDGPSPHSPYLHHGLTTHQPLRRHHAQTLLGPSFHDPNTPHVLESHPEQAPPLSHRGDVRRHAVCSHSIAPLFCSLQPILKLFLSVLDHLCSNSSQLFTLAESQKPGDL